MGHFDNFGSSGSAVVGEDAEVTHAEEAPPSIGVWFSSLYLDTFNPAGAYEPNNDRVKLSLAGHPLTIGNLNRWLQMLRQRAGRLDSKPGRIAFKVLIPHDTNLEDLKLGGDGLALEGVVPVKGHPTVAGIAYFGYCTPERAPTADFMQGCKHLWAEAQKAQHRSLPGNIICERFTDNVSLDEATQIAKVYAQCFTGYLVDLSNPANVQRMLNGGGISLGVRDKNNKWVAVAIGERVTIPVIGQPSISFWEVSDVATDPKHRGFGYARALYAALVAAIRAQDPNAVITTEIRANWAPLYKIMAAEGWTLASHGYADGFLRAQCRISSDAESVEQGDNPFGSLALFYC